MAFHQSALFEKTKLTFRERNTFFKLKPVTPQYTQLTVLTKLYVALWKIPLILKGLNETNY